tara:strand:- start:769 stop:969 length:201 start_codon:yes stop_codon:yes gene_type:complete
MDTNNIIEIESIRELIKKYNPNLLKIYENLIDIVNKKISIINDDVDSSSSDSEEYYNINPSMNGFS